jgi:hypothetical protein
MGTALRTGQVHANRLELQSCLIRLHEASVAAAD